MSCSTKLTTKGIKTYNPLTNTDIVKLLFCPKQNYGYGNYKKLIETDMVIQSFIEFSTINDNNISNAFSPKEISSLGSIIQSRPINLIFSMTVGYNVKLEN